MDKLLIIASFGTTHRDTYIKNIEAIERHITNLFPDWNVETAFTSSVVINALAKKGKKINDVPAALKNAQLNGIKEVAILPTHLLYGIEYEKLCGQAEQYRNAFERLHIGSPLLASTNDLLEITDIISKEFHAEDGQCIVLLGHGTQHYVNPVYAALEYMFRQNGRNDIFVGTVEAYPSIEQVLHQIKQGKYSRVLLTPFMLVAGDHAANDMAGEKDSWKSTMEENGLEVNTVMRGLGEIPHVQKMYENHAHALLKYFA